MYMLQSLIKPPILTSIILADANEITKDGDGIQIRELVLIQIDRPETTPSCLLMASPKTTCCYRRQVLLGVSMHKQHVISIGFTMSVDSSLPVAANAFTNHNINFLI